MVGGTHEGCVPGFETLTPGVFPYLAEGAVSDSANAWVQIAFAPR